MRSPQIRSSVNTHGCIRSAEQKKLFRVGLQAMIDEHAPTDVLVHGHMPDLLTAFAMRPPCKIERAYMGKSVTRTAAENDRSAHI